jgi:hypothetical protein
LHATPVHNGNHAVVIGRCEAIAEAGNPKQSLRVSAIASFLAMTTEFGF